MYLKKLSLVFMEHFLSWPGRGGAQVLDHPVYFDLGTLPTVIVEGSISEISIFTRHFNLLSPPNLRNLKNDFESF